MSAHSAAVAAVPPLQHHIDLPPASAESVIAPALSPSSSSSSASPSDQSLRSRGSPSISPSPSSSSSSSSPASVASFTYTLPCGKRVPVRFRRINWLYLLLYLTVFLLVVLDNPTDVNAPSSMSVSEWQVYRVFIQYSFIYGTLIGAADGFQCKKETLAICVNVAANIAYARSGNPAFLKFLAVEDPTTLAERWETIWPNQPLPPELLKRIPQPALVKAWDVKEAELGRHQFTQRLVKSSFVTLICAFLVSLLGGVLGETQIFKANVLDVLIACVVAVLFEVAATYSPGSELWTFLVQLIVFIVGINGGPAIYGAFRQPDRHA